MVPIADAFNHTEENHVHLETDWQVCSECGSLDKCEHDAQDNTSKDMGSQKLEHTYDMVLDTSLSAGKEAEVYNTYDSHGIDNVHLLCRYGFILEGNSRDVVLFAAEEVIQAGGVATAIENAVGEFAFGPSEMINAAMRDLGIDAEGRISLSLWVAFVPVAHWTRLARTQFWVENQAMGQERDGFGDIANDTNPTQRDFLDTHEAALKIVRLCTRRLERMWDPMKDDGPTSSSNRMPLGGSGPSDKETTALDMAEGYILGERAIIEACRTAWRDFLVIVHQYRMGPSKAGSREPLS